MAVIKHFAVINSTANKTNTLHHFHRQWRIVAPYENDEVFFCFRRLFWNRIKINTKKKNMCYNNCMLKKICINNRRNLKLSLRVTFSENNEKLVFLLHGLGARNDYPHMLVIEETFAKHGYNVVNIDTTNSNNESDKSEEGITFTGTYNDLEDVIAWAKTQKFYKEPFSLAGQSMGAVACTLYAGNNSKQVDYLLVANFSWIDGKIESQRNKRREEILQNGYYVQTSKSTGKSFIIQRNYLDDLEMYNLTEAIQKITAKVSIIIGMADSEYHKNNGEILYELLKSKKELYKLAGVPHDLANTPEDKRKFKQLLNNILLN